jgi:hypothetical protein
MAVLDDLTVAQIAANRGDLLSRLGLTQDLHSVAVAQE